MAGPEVNMDENTARRVARVVQRVEATPELNTAPTAPVLEHSPLPFFIGVVSSTDGIAPTGYGSVTPWNYIAASSAFAATGKDDETCHDWFMTGASYLDRVMYWRHRLSGKLIFLRTLYAIST